MLSIFPGSSLICEHLWGFYPCKVWWVQWALRSPHFENLKVTETRWNWSSTILITHLTSSNSIRAAKCFMNFFELFYLMKQMICWILMQNSHSTRILNYSPNQLLSNRFAYEVIDLIGFVKYFLENEKYLGRRPVRKIRNDFHFLIRFLHVRKTDAAVGINEGSWFHSPFSLPIYPMDS